MKYRSIPHTDLRPSQICMGTASFGTDIDEVSAFELLDTFFERGGNFLDTAHAYGAWVPGGLGLSEKVIGKWLKERGLREQMIIGTKGAHPHFDTPHLPRLAHDDIVSDIDESLQCLQIESIDLYWLHRDDPTRPVADIVETLNEQVTRGKIRYFGFSNWQMQRIVEAMEYTAQHHIAGLVGNQLMWSFAVPNPDGIEDKSLVFMDAPTLEFHRKTDLAVLAFTPQARGFFSKLNTNAAGLSDKLRTTYDNAENLERLRRLQTVSNELSLAIPTLLLAYLTNQSFPAFPIAGSANKQQLLENLQAGDVVLSAETLRYLEDGAAS